LADGRLGRAQVLIDNLPEGGQHPYRFVTVSPDGWVYVVVGSYWNAAPEPTLDHAAVLRIRPDGTERQRVATGLRHMVGIDWHPETNEIWGMDQGADWHMMDIPPEELNRIRPGAHYGYPWCYGQRQPDPLIQQHPPHTTQEAFCAQTEPSAMVYQAHSSPTGFLFYRGTQFPPAYRNDAYVTLLGSTHRKEPVGFKLIRIHYDEAGKPVSISDFLSGFLTEEGKAEFGRPAGLAQWPDGSLLMSDTGHGVIYRITYSGSAS
jgi:glucose/arabinose dehydrogenase